MRPEFEIVRGKGGREPTQRTGGGGGGGEGERRDKSGKQISFIPGKGRAGSGGEEEKEFPVVGQTGMLARWEKIQTREGETRRWNSRVLTVLRVV